MSADTQRDALVGFLAPITPSGTIETAADNAVAIAISRVAVPGPIAIAGAWVAVTAPIAIPVTRGAVAGAVAVARIAVAGAIAIGRIAVTRPIAITESRLTVAVVGRSSERATG